MTSYSDKIKYKGTTETISRGKIKDNMIIITKQGFPQKEWCIKITKDEIQKAMKKYFNENYGIHELVSIKINLANKEWIESIPKLKDIRQANYDKGYDTGLVNDSVERVVKHLYKELI